MTDEAFMTGGTGAAFYDRPGVLARYTSHRAAGVSSPNAVMEEPAVLAELGDVAGARVVDLGCGDAAIGERLLAAGAASYLGVDASVGMTQMAAQRLTPLGGQIRLTPIETFDTEPASADLIISRLALHYVQDVAEVFARCRRWLAPGGRLIVTVLHPVITSHDARTSSGQLRTNWTVDDYFDTGARPQRWMGDDVTFFHRTIEQYFHALTGAGFQVTSLRECEPQRECFHGDDTEYARRRRIPMFLLLNAK